MIEVFEIIVEKRKINIISSDLKLTRGFSVEEIWMNRKCVEFYCWLVDGKLGELSLEKCAAWMNRKCLKMCCKEHFPSTRSKLCF